MTDFFRQRAEEIVELADRLEQTFVERNADIGGLISVGATEAVGSRLFARLIKDFIQYPLILLSKEKVRAEILNWMKCEEKDLHILLSYTLLSNAVLLVEQGLGCAFCLDGRLPIHSSSDLQFIPIIPERTTQYADLEKESSVFSGRFSFYPGNQYASVKNGVERRSC